jgi:hypothetical protein
MAAVLKNEGLLTGEQVRQRFGQVVEPMAEAGRQARSLRGEKIWIITEADRTSTCLLLPDEY